MKPLTIQFPFNPVLSYMEYTTKDREFGELTLYFKKTKGKREARTYSVSREVAYKMVYCKNAAEVMDYFNNLIKNITPIINVKTIRL